MIIKQPAQIRSNIVATGSPQDESVLRADLWPVNEHGTDCDYWTAHRVQAQWPRSFYAPSALFSGACIGGNGELWLVGVELLPAAALFASHRAFIVAESCARRSGERFSFLFGFLVPPDAVARAADFLAAFNAFADSLRLKPASFSGPSRKRFSSCWIFFLNFFSFMLSSSWRRTANVKIGFRVNDKISPMSRPSLATCALTDIGVMRCCRPDESPPWRRVILGLLRSGFTKPVPVTQRSVRQSPP